MTDVLLHVQNVVKVFEPPFSCRELFSRGKARVTALDNISFSLEKGKILGILGPNGAGKTTLLKIIATLILPDSGTVLVKNYRAECHGRQIRAITGLAASDERSFYWRLTGLQNMEFYAALFGLNKQEASSRLDELFRVFNVTYQHKRFDSYSTGMKRKFILMRALLHRPRVLLLDEPTRSLDYDTGHSLRDHIKKLAANGTTILFATHNIEEAQEVCDSFMILNRGRSSGVGTLDELREKVKSPGADLRTLYLRFSQHA